MKKAILILLVLLLLGGGAGGYFFFLREKPEGETAAEVPAPKPPVPGEFVEIEPVTLPVIRGGRALRLATFRIVLELNPSKTANDLRPDLPRLQDAALMQLTSLAALNWPDGAVLDPAVARERLFQRFQRILKPDVVAKVLIRGIFEGAG